MSVFEIDFAGLIPLALSSLKDCFGETPMNRKAMDTWLKHEFDPISDLSSFKKRVFIDTLVPKLINGGYITYNHEQRGLVFATPPVEVNTDKKEQEQEPTPAPVEDTSEVIQPIDLSAVAYTISCVVEQPRAINSKLDTLIELIAANNSMYKREHEEWKFENAKKRSNQWNQMHQNPR
jgi:hypothetical protein